MEFIGKDKGGDWHFDGNETFWCLDKNKKPVGKIYGKHLPDPFSLWQQKANNAEVDMKSIEGKALKPSPVVFKLWEVWNAKSN